MCTRARRTSCLLHRHLFCVHSLKEQLYQTSDQLTTRRNIVRWSLHNLPALLLLTALLSLFVAAPTAQAATITADGVTCTLVDAITAANSDTAVGAAPPGAILTRSP